MKKIIIWLIVLVIIIGLGIGSYFMFFSGEKIIEDFNTENWKTYSNDEDFNTENWKTYSNDEFGYSFKYPERFSVIQPLEQGYEGGNILVDPDSSYIAIYVVAIPDRELKEGSEDLIINGHRAKLSSPFEEYQTGISIFKGENLIHIYLMYVKNKVNQDDRNLVMKIISTIELTD